MDQERLWALTGRHCYDYDALCEIDDTKLEAYCASVKRQFAVMAGEWSDEKTTEWIARNYLALKYILAAQLKVSAAFYATQHNLQIVVPYLHYYLLFHCCRAFLLTRPNEPMTISSASHGKIINCTVSTIGSVSNEFQSNLRQLLERSQSLRELFSYKFPATGMGISKQHPSGDETYLWARRLAEFAELNSECLAAAVEERCAGQIYEVDWARFRQLCQYSTPTQETDRHDRSRLDYLSRAKLPYELVAVARQGLIEDFFGAWVADEELGLPEHAFDPDHNDGPSIFRFN